MKAVIVEDEAALILRLKELLGRYCKQVSVVGVAQDANTGKKLILSLKPDLVFLDIQMPIKSGFDMLGELGAYDFEVIFVTGHDRYGIQAVKVSALDYLLKPVKGSELRKAVIKAEEKQSRHHTQEQVENLLSFIRHSGVAGHRIAVPIHKGLRYLNPDEIVRCEASNNYTIFYLVPHEKLLVSRGMYEYEEMLSHYGFIRCHQSHLVNKKHIKSLKRDDHINDLLLSDGSKVPVSRNGVGVVREALGRK